MKRKIIAVMGLVLVIGVIGGVLAVSALACNPTPRVCAPNNFSNGQSGYHAPPRVQKAVIPSNQGTNTAVDQSPAIDYFCGQD